MITKYILFLESINQALIYDKESKVMIGVYKVISKDDEFVTLENSQEIPEIRGGQQIFYANNMLSANRYIRIIKLPTDKITIGNKIEDGYFEIKIPYWLYKDYKAILDIKKLDPEKYQIRDR